MTDIPSLTELSEDYFKYNDGGDNQHIIAAPQLSLPALQELNESDKLTICAQSSFDFSQVHPLARDTMIQHVQNASVIELEGTISLLNSLAEQGVLDTEVLIKMSDDQTVAEQAQNALNQSESVISTCATYDITKLDG